MRKTLIIGYGNPDRQDDGIAWHILAAVARYFEYPLPSSWEEGFQPSPQHPNLELHFALQLVPELAEHVAQFERVGFVDAHTGRVPEEINFEVIAPDLQNSPFTHHLTPATLGYLTRSLYAVHPEAVLLSVRGYEFGFAHHLSEQTSALLPSAVNTLIGWIHGEQSI